MDDGGEIKPLINAEPQKLTLLKKIVYGVGETGVYGASVIEGFFLNSFLLEVAGIKPYLAGIVLLIGQITDSITSPLIGKASDGINTKYGRRRPWILGAAIPFAIGYFMLWQTYPSMSQTALLIYYTSMIVIMNSMSNAIVIPYSALTPSLADTYDDSTVLTKFRMMSDLIWALIITFVHTNLMEAFPLKDDPKLVDYALGYRVSAVIYAVISIVPPILVFIFIKEDQSKYTKSEENFSGGIKDFFSTLKNPQYASLCGMYVTGWTAVCMIQNNLYLWTKYVLRKETYFMWVISLILLMSSIGVALWTKVSEKIGKKKTYYIGILMAITILIPTYFFGDTTPLALVFAVPILAGVGIGVAFLIPWSMLPDVVMIDEKKTGIKREGAFYSLFILLQKIGLAAALAGSSFYLEFSGYISPEDEDFEKRETDFQPESAKLALRILLAPVPLVLFILSLVSLWFYNITKEDLDMFEEIGHSDSEEVLNDDQVNYNTLS
eukprot:TRINITY_DN6692_c0_g1_i1.p1 TRINITY_DN6692_c0_g1~~TRINITY_DN6692_c0_g1_i1.p1  ORF type:complete len:494 (+),score=63.49 TRINITY_DN6692_c0_g1_i1:23-1504(+)